MADNEAAQGAGRAQAAALALGERLRSARKARALTVAQVAQALHLEEPIVVALEEEQFDSLGPPTMGVHELSTCYRLTHHRDTPCASDEHPCPLQITKRTKQPVVVEHVHYDQEGNSRMLEIHGFPILDRAGRVTEMIEYSLDVTSRKNAEQELRNTKDDLNNLMESSLDAIIVTDRMGYITRVNKYFLELFGYSKEEVLGKQVLQLTPFEDFGTFASTTGEAVEIGRQFIDVANQMITELIEKGKVTNWEAYYFRKDKKVVPVEQNIVNLFNTEGKKTGAVAITRDITERKQAADALKRSEAYLDNIIESSLTRSSPLTARAM